VVPRSGRGHLASCLGPRAKQYCPRPSCRPPPSRRTETDGGDLLQTGKIADQSRPGGSSWQSLQRRTGNIETGYLKSGIVLLGHMCEVATPANELMQALARDLAAHRGAPGAVPAATIIERLENARRSARATSG